jgi:hypothetical protein
MSNSKTERCARIRISIGWPPWIRIRIRIAVKSWIRIRSPVKNGGGSCAPLHGELLRAQELHQGAHQVRELLVASQVARDAGEVQVFDLRYGPEHPRENKLVSY